MRVDLVHAYEDPELFCFFLSGGVGVHVPVDIQHPQERAQRRYELFMSSRDTSSVAREHDDTAILGTTHVLCEHCTQLIFE